MAAPQLAEATLLTISLVPPLLAAAALALLVALVYVQIATARHDGPACPPPGSPH